MPGIYARVDSCVTDVSAQGRVSVSPIRPRHLSHLGTVRTTLYGILSHPKQLPRKPHTDALPTAKPATCST